MDKIIFDLKFERTYLKHAHSHIEHGFIPLREREVETILSLGNGYMGTRNSLEESYPECSPGSFIAGIYEEESTSFYNFLVRVPDWTRMQVFIDDELINIIDTELLQHHRYIDLNNGLGIREWQCRDTAGRITSIKTIKYISLDNKHELGKSIIIKPENYTANLTVKTGIDGNTINYENYQEFISDTTLEFGNIYLKTKFSRQLISLAQKSEFIGKNKSSIINPVKYTKEFYKNTIFDNYQWKAEIGSIYAINSLVTSYNTLDTNNPLEKSQRHLKETPKSFFINSAKNHIKKWQQRWSESEIKLFGNDYDQKLINFALYHLITSGEFSGNKYSIPARNLSGESYKGHIFWDTEMYLLPFFIYTKPEIAKNLLMYRYNTLNGARENAKKEGFNGASFAWESTDSGKEMTPESVVLPSGETVYILSGKYENHISADIAYAIWQYWQATHDIEFMCDFGAEILFETARYCGSLLSLSNDDFFHVPNVIGPDEYHEIIDNNAYTNYLIKHNFEIALKAYQLLSEKEPEKLYNLKQKLNLSSTEIDEWKKYKNNIFTGFNEESKLYEQFKGYFELEDIDLNQYALRSAPMDVLLGRERTQNSQVIKQADVLMFLYLFGENFDKDIIKTNYEYYEKRTGHGSSLSPSIHSIIAARIGKNEEAYRYFKKNAQIDIGDEFGNASGGIHIAATGGVWLSTIMGFAGFHPTEKGLVFTPNFPKEWEELNFSINWRNQKINITLTNTEMSFNTTGTENVFISTGFDNWKTIEPKKTYFAQKINDYWNWKE